MSIFIYINLFTNQILADNINILNDDINTLNDNMEFEEQQTQEQQIKKQHAQK